MSCIIHSFHCSYSVFFILCIICSSVVAWWASHPLLKGTLTGLRTTFFGDMVFCPKLGETKRFPTFLDHMNGYFFLGDSWFPSVKISLKMANNAPISSFLRYQWSPWHPSADLEVQLRSPIFSIFNLEAPHTTQYTISGPLIVGAKIV